MSHLYNVSRSDGFGRMVVGRSNRSLYDAEMDAEEQLQRMSGNWIPPLHSDFYQSQSSTNQKGEDKETPHEQAVPTRPPKSPEPADPSRMETSSQVEFGPPEVILGGCSLLVIGLVAVVGVIVAIVTGKATQK